jgi:hypothetical protein
MPDTPTPVEPSPEWLKLMAGLIHSGSFIAREEREKIAAALSRLAQVERPRDHETIMKEWDKWREYIANGGGGSWPRDAFESLLDDYAYHIAQAERERDASDAKTLEEAAQLCDRLAAAVKVGGNCGESLGGLILRQEIARQPYERCAAEIRRAAIERHKRSRQQRA